MSVKLHLSSGKEFISHHDTAESVLALMSEYDSETGYLTFNSTDHETNQDVYEVIMMKHIERITEY